jgi:putative serine protease PepD
MSETPEQPQGPSQDGPDQQRPDFVGHDQATPSASQPAPEQQPSSASASEPTWANGTTYDSASQSSTTPAGSFYDYGNPPSYQQSSYGQNPYRYGPVAGATDTMAQPTTKPQRRRGRGMLVVATALVAGLIGGGVGAAGTHALDDNGAKTTSSASSVAAAPISASTSGSVAAVAKKLLPSVVSINASNSQESGTGTGVVLDTAGHILTNNHVVVPSLSGGKLTVTLNSGRTVTATLVGRDPVSDLAVIQIKGVSNLTPANLGDSGSLVVGQSVVAIGSPLGLTGTVTSGIVSALDRPVRTASEEEEQQQQQQTNPYGLGGSGSTGSQGQSNASTQATVVDAIQTDAAINPGNSGGPLVDMNGNVIGINSSIASLGTSSDTSQSGSIGLGFAIPINVVKPIVTQLISTGKATHSLLGVTIGDTSDSSGAKVSAVTKGGAADKAGLAAGDVITKVGSRVTPDADSVIAAVRSLRPGDQVALTVTRDGSTKTFTATLGSD